MFLKDLSDIVGMDIKYDKWEIDQSTIGVGDGLVAATSSTTVTTLSDHTDPIWIAAQAGFKVKALVVESSQRDGRAFTIESVFKIVKIGESVEMVQVCAYDGKAKSVQIPLAKLLTLWNLSKATVPIQMTSGQQRTVALYVEDKKAAIFSAILEADKLNKAGESITFWRRPDEIRTTVRIPKGHLVLAPVCPLVNISTKSSAASLSLGKHDVETIKKSMEFFATPVSKPSFEEGASEWKEVVIAGAKGQCAVIAFWWIGTTHVKAEANLSLDWVFKKGINVPVLKNTAELQPFTKLLQFKAKALLTAPLVGAIILKDMADEGPAKKRSKA
jgi:hypothetical protein